MKEIRSPLGLLLKPPWRLAYFRREPGIPLFLWGKDIWVANQEPFLESAQTDRPPDPDTVGGQEPLPACFVLPTNLLNQQGLSVAVAIERIVLAEDYAWSVKGIPFAYWYGRCVEEAQRWNYVVAL